MARSREAPAEATCHRRESRGPARHRTLRPPTIGDRAVPRNLESVVGPFVVPDVRSAGIDPPSRALSRDAFDAFYTDALPIVFGYLVKLCGGDREQAWDLTQDAWMVVVERLNAGVDRAASIPYVVSVARTKYIDSWRRQQRLQRKLRLVWSGERSDDGGSPSAGVVLEHLADCSPTNRLLLMLAYVDEVPVADIADQIGKPVSSTYSMLARARTELRERMTGGVS